MIKRTKTASPKSNIKKAKVRRDGTMKSPWQSVPVAKGTIIPSITYTESYDAIIIGGGITGMTTAYLLQKSGKRCILIEAHNVGFGTTGGTSAHINTFADTTYKEAENAFVKEGAKLFAAAINEGFSIIRKNIKDHRIQCDFEEKQGFLYAEDEDQASQLKDVYEGCLNCDVTVVYTENVPTPVKFHKALMFNGQAQFHPLKYLQAIQSAYFKAGGIILENTMVTSVESKDGIHIVNAGTETIKSQNVIYATHIPPGLNIFSLRCAPYRSYVLGVTLADGAYPDALVYDMQEPYHYFRTHAINGKKYLIAGGNDHKTGHDDPDEAFNKLESYIRKHYNVSTVKYKWSSQYYVPVDGLPYIGQMPGREPGIFCATGFNGNGMMLGSVAAAILSDLASGRKNKYEALFAPGRIKPIAGFKEFVSENADVAYQFVASRMPAHEVDFLKRLKKDTGKIVEFDGKKMAVYRDNLGNVHALNPVCTHARCIVNWNGEEKSWDCPCHGARYDINGNVLNGPAEKNLEKITFEADKK